MTVLHIDPDRTTTRMVQRQLAQFGIESIALADSSLAMKTIKKLSPDLVILEVHISGLDGHQVLRAIRTDPETEDLKVMFLTAMHQEQVVARAINHRVDGYVQKINSFGVAAEVKRLLGLGPQSEP